jgi:hypothetical protein
MFFTSIWLIFQVDGVRNIEHLYQKDTQTLQNSELEQSSIYFEYNGQAGAVSGSSGLWVAVRQNVVDKRPDCHGHKAMHVSASKHRCTEAGMVGNGQPVVDLPYYCRANCYRSWPLYSSLPSSAPNPRPHRLDAIPSATINHGAFHPSPAAAPAAVLDHTHDSRCR